MPEGRVPQEVASFAALVALPLHPASIRIHDKKRHHLSSVLHNFHKKP
jgi:hypothetical protein